MVRRRLQDLLRSSPELQIGSILVRVPNSRIPTPVIEDVGRGVTAAVSSSSVVSGTSPRRTAIAAISARPLAPSFDLMFETCTLAVFSLMNRSTAISQFVCPAVRRSSTSCSRLVSAEGGPHGRGTRRPDAGLFVAGALAMSSRERDGKLLDLSLE